MLTFRFFSNDTVASSNLLNPSIALSATKTINPLARSLATPLEALDKALILSFDSANSLLKVSAASAIPLKTLPTIGID